MSNTPEQPSVEVTGPVAVPYPFGLFSLPFAGVPSEPGWQGGGVWWNTSACQPVGITYGQCNVDSSLPPVLDSNVECSWSPSAPSFTVYARSTRSVGGGSLEEKFAQARDVLAAGEQFAVEELLWAALMAATTVGAGTAATSVEAVALAELAISAVYGGTPVLHMDRRTATLGESVLHTEGARLKSLLGSSVVAGGGYGPVGAAKPAVIATGGIQIFRSEMFDLGQHIDQATNEISAVVERTYVVGWDCTATRINIT